MWYGQDMMWYTLLYDMIMFCKSYRQLAGALWLSLYCMKCKRHVIALLYHYALAIVVEAIVGETTTMQRWRSRCRVGDDGDHDHDDALKMEIKGTRWWWPYHVTYFDCMWCLSFIHLILLSIFDCMWCLSFKVQVFSLSMHRCQSSSCRDTTWWSGVISSTFTYNGCKPVLHT